MFSMINDSLTQHDLDVMVRGGRRRAHGDWCTLPVLLPPHLPESHLCSKAPEAGDTVWDDQISQMSKESTDQNLPHDSDLDEDELLGMITDISVPRGHLD